jgi:hypothetical protein
MPAKNSIVVVYETHMGAEAGVREMQRTRFDLQQLSVLGKEYHSEERVVGYYTSGDRMKYWGDMGAFWGGLWDSLAGAAFFVVPGIGPVLIAGPLGAWVVNTMEGAEAVDGLSVLGAALYSIGIPRDSIRRYESALKADKLLLVAHGTVEEVEGAKDVLRRTQPAEVNLHFAEEGAMSLA